MSGDLGDFSPFLEVAFGVNVLFGVWRDLFANLLKKRLVVRKENAKVFVAINERYLDTKDGYMKWHDRTLKYGRACAICFAVAIAVVLLMAGVYPTYTVRGVAMWLLIIMALPWPVSFIVINIVHQIYKRRDGRISNFIKEQTSAKMDGLMPDGENSGQE